MFTDDERYLLTRGLQTLRRDLQRKTNAARRKLISWTDAHERDNPGYREATRAHIDRNEHQLDRIAGLLARLQPTGLPERNRS